jgi:hypothetical protein
MPLDERSNRDYPDAPSVLGCGGPPPLFRRIAENRISPNARRNFNWFTESLPTHAIPAWRRLAGSPELFLS